MAPNIGAALDIDAAFGLSAQQGSSEMRTVD